MQNKTKIFNNILIVDGSYLLHRVLNVPHVQALCTSTGLKSGGVFKFLQSLIIESKKFQKFPIICWDAGLDPRRLEADPNYKGQRIRANQEIDFNNPDEFRKDEFLKQYKSQKKVIIEILENLDIPNLNIKNWEGDDLMYILGMLSTNSILMSDDKDMIQALSDTVDVYRPMMKTYLKQNEFLTLEGFESVREFVVTKSIVGDVSDNIPKIADGLGEKGAKKLAKIIVECISRNDSRTVSTQSHDLNNLIKREVLANKNGHKLALNYDRFLTNMELIDLSKIEITDEITTKIVETCRNHINSQIGNRARALEILNEYEIKSLNISNYLAILTIIKGSVFRSSNDERS